MNVQEINRAIVACQFSNDELNSIADAVRFARSQMTQQNRRSLVVGTKVKFTNNRTGQDIIGTVEKVAIKFITIRETNNRGFSSGLWRVPANMLQAV